MERQLSTTIETYPFPYFEDCTKDGILLKNNNGLGNLDLLEFSSSCAFTRDSFRKLIQIYNDGKDKFAGRVWRVFGNEESNFQLYKKIRNPRRIYVTHISSFNKTTFILLSDGTARIGQQYGSFGFDRYYDDVRGLTIISDESNVKPTRKPFTVFTYPIDLILDATSIKSRILSGRTSGIRINFKTETLPLLLTFKKNNLVPLPLLLIFKENNLVQRDVKDNFSVVASSLRIPSKLQIKDVACGLKIFYVLYNDNTTDVFGENVSEGGRLMMMITHTDPTILIKQIGCGTRFTATLYENGDFYSSECLFDCQRTIDGWDYGPIHIVPDKKK